MAIDPKTLTDKQVDMIADPNQRREVVKKRGFETTAKSKAKTEAKLEKDLHNEYISFCRRNELPYIHASMVKKSTIQKGAPDFCVTLGRKYLYGEFKVPGETLSEDQEKYFAYLQRRGCPVYLWYDYETATKDTAAFFGLDLHSVANDAMLSGGPNERNATHTVEQSAARHGRDRAG
jgi:VRR-NUC domain